MEEFDSAELLTPAQAARRFGVSVATIVRWTDTKKIPSFRTLGGHRRYKRSDIERLIKETEIN